MISRYALYQTDQLRDRFTLPQGLPKGIRPSYNISPAQTVPVVVERNGQRIVEKMMWGFLPQGAKNANSIFRYKTQAVRSEKVLEKHSYRFAIRSQRCIIPVNGFYEWKQAKDQKRPFYLHSGDDKLLGLAGIYSTWTDAEEQEQSLCAVLTIDTESTDNMMPRTLPIVIEQSHENDWLNPTIGDLSTLYEIMRPTGHNTFIVTPVGEAINSTKVDTPELIKRLVR